MQPGHIRILSLSITKGVFTLANSAGPDETSLFAASHLGLRCLYMFLFEYIQSIPQMLTLNFRLAMPLAIVMHTSKADY